MTEPEKILASRVQTIEEWAAGRRGFIATDRVPPHLVTHARVVPRTPALEEDESWRQWVAYTVLTRGTSIFAYLRKSGADPRLASKVSMGVGGHVRHDDGPALGDAPAGAARRELAEEAGLAGLDVRFRGLLCDSGTPVSRCHLGMIFTVEVPQGLEPVLEPGLEPVGWRDPLDLPPSREVEPWTWLLIPSVVARLRTGEPKATART